MQDTQDKVTVAKEQAAKAWAKWAVANDACREAYYTFMKQVGSEGETYYKAYYKAYTRYTEACQQRDDFYAEAVEFAEEFWRQDCNA